MLLVLSVLEYAPSRMKLGIENGVFSDHGYVFNEQKVTFTCQGNVNQNTAWLRLPFSLSYSYKM